MFFPVRDRAFIASINRDCLPFPLLITIASIINRNCFTLLIIIAFYRQLLLFDIVNLVIIPIYITLAIPAINLIFFSSLHLLYTYIITTTTIIIIILILILIIIIISSAITITIITTTTTATTTTTTITTTTTTTTTAAPAAISIRYWYRCQQAII